MTVEDPPLAHMRLAMTGPDSLTDPAKRPTSARAQPFRGDLPGREPRAQ